MTKPNCFNRQDYADTVTVQDGWKYVSLVDGHADGLVRTRVPNMLAIPDPMSKECMQHSPHGAATIYGWDCEGCKHEPEAPR